MSKVPVGQIANWNILSNAATRINRGGKEDFALHITQYVKWQYSVPYTVSLSAAHVYMQLSLDDRGHKMAT